MQFCEGLPLSAFDSQKRALLRAADAVLSQFFFLTKLCIAYIF
jgi:hypothetical protein